MSIYLSHQTALAYWTFSASSSSESIKAAKVRSLSDSCLRLSELDDLEPLGLGSIHAPYHALIDQASKRHLSKLGRPHLWTGQLCDACFYRLYQGLYLSTPEFALLQMAPILPLPELIWLVSLYCSQYRYEPHPTDHNAQDSSKEGAAEVTRAHYEFLQAEKLTTLQRLGSFLRRMKGSYGSANLKQALRYAVEDAFSPMEMAVGLMFSCRRSIGGYGLAPLGLNATIKLSEQAVKLCGKREIHPDFLFPNKVIAEYDSYAYHADREKLAEDRARYNALVSMGYKPLGITAESSQTISGLDGIYQATLQTTGRQARPLSLPPWERERLLKMFLNRKGATLDAILR